MVQSFMRDISFDALSWNFIGCGDKGNKRETRGIREKVGFWYI